MKTNSHDASTSSSVPACTVGDPQPFEVVAATGPDDLAAGPHPHVRQLSDLLDQVVRHRALEGLGPRTMMVTLRAVRAKNTAAWPAELAPPTM